MRIAVIKPNQRSSVLHAVPGMRVQLEDPGACLVCPLSQLPVLLVGVVPGATSTVVQAVATAEAEESQALDEGGAEDSLVETDTLEVTLQADEVTAAVQRLWSSLSAAPPITWPLAPGWGFSGPSARDIARAFARQLLARDQAFSGQGRSAGSAVIRRFGGLLLLSEFVAAAEADLSLYDTLGASVLCLHYAVSCLRPWLCRANTECCVTFKRLVESVLFAMSTQGPSQQLHQVVIDATYMIALPSAYGDKTSAIFTDQAWDTDMRAVAPFLSSVDAACPSPVSFVIASKHVVSFCASLTTPSSVQPIAFIPSDSLPLLSSPPMLYVKGDGAKIAYLLHPSVNSSLIQALYNLLAMSMSLNNTTQGQVDKTREWYKIMTDRLSDFLGTLDSAVEAALCDSGRRDLVIAELEAVAAANPHSTGDRHTATLLSLGKSALFFAGSSTTMAVKSLAAQIDKHLQGNQATPAAGWWRCHSLTQCCPRTRPRPPCCACYSWTGRMTRAGAPPPLARRCWQAWQCAS